MTPDQIERAIRQLSKKICCLSLSSKKFGVAGEDDIATENRIFSLDQFALSLLDEEGNSVFFLDPINNNHFFGIDTLGDHEVRTGWLFDNTNQIEGRAAGKVGLRIVESITGLEAYLGDVDNVGNGARLRILDASERIDTAFGTNLKGISIRNTIETYRFGDFDSINNGTQIEINDNIQAVNITNVPTGAITDDFATFDGDQIKKIPAPVESGTYTPTITNDANAQNISTDGAWQYMRVGNVVTVSGNFNVEAIAAAGTQTTVFFNPPIFSDFPTGVEAGGTAWGTVSMINGGQVIMASSNTLQCKWFAAANGSADYVAIHFTYLIVAAP